MVGSSQALLAAIVCSPTCSCDPNEVEGGMAPPLLVILLDSVLPANDWDLVTLLVILVVCLLFTLPSELLKLLLRDCMNVYNLNVHNLMCLVYYNTFSTMYTLAFYLKIRHIYMLQMIRFHFNKNIKTFL